MKTYLFLLMVLITNIARAEDTVLIDIGKQSLNNSTLITLNFKVKSAASTDKFFCSIDESPDYPCTSPITLSAIQYGRHIFSVSAYDQKGKKKVTGALSWELGK